ncbi:MAG: FeoA domain-containing protein [Helicobacter sp.]|nr:FeoA domain-containing protein [Helicobacter sp.]
MTLDALKDGEVATISHFDVNEQLLNRFFSLGFAKSKKIKKIKTSLGGSTILVELDRNCVMLRNNEAKSIEVIRNT